MGSAILSKLKEGSTWAGIGGFIATLSFIPHAKDIGQTIGLIGVGIASSLAIWFPN
jgi:hypothetical protein